MSAIENLWVAFFTVYLLVAKPYLFDVDKRVNWAQKNLPLAGFKAKVLLSIMELS